MKILLYILGWVSLPLYICAQSTPQNFRGTPQVETALYWGHIMHIHPDFPSTNPISMIEVNGSFQLRGYRDWHQNLGYPEIGIALQYTSFGNLDTLGSSFAVVPNITLRKQIAKHRIVLEWRASTGLAWCNKPYDLFKNPGNEVIGSRFSAVIELSGGIHWRLSPSWALRLGGAIIHYSNGHTAVPNIGANMVTGYLGMKYDFKPNAGFYQATVEKPPHRWRLNLLFGLGLHEIEGTTASPDGPTYPVYVISGYASKRLSRVHNLQVGVHYHYYTAYHDQIVLEDLFDKNYGWNATNIAVFAGDEVMIGRLSFIANLGYNVFNPFKARYLETDMIKWVEVRMFAKVGLQYYPIRQLADTRHRFFVGLYLKTISGKAEFAQLGAGYTF